MTASVVTLASMRGAVRYRANMENSGFVTDAEINGYLNASIRRVYNLLVAARGHEYYRQTATINVIAGTAAYTLPLDFSQLLRAEQSFNGVTIPLRSFTMDQRSAYDAPFGPTGVTPFRYRLAAGQIEFIPLPTSSVPVVLYFIPGFVPLVSDGDTYDGIMGWEDGAIWDAVAICLAKEESDNSFALGMRARVEEEIKGLAPARDASQPERVADRSAVGWEF